jgi:hypothetical protein
MFQTSELPTGTAQSAHTLFEVLSYFVTYALQSGTKFLEEKRDEITFLSTFGFLNGQFEVNTYIGSQQELALLGSLYDTYCSTASAGKAVLRIFNLPKDYTGLDGFTLIQLVDIGHFMLVEGVPLEEALLYM